MPKFIHQQLSKSEQFNVNDIDAMSVNVIIDKAQSDTLKQIAKSLNVASFKAVSVKTVSFLDFLDESLPVLDLTGKGYEIAITRKKITISFLSGAGIIRDSPIKDYKDIKKEDLFSQTNLSSVDSDFNFIMGLILGRLGTALEDVEVLFELNVSKEGKLKNDFNHIIKDESKALFGKLSDLHLKEIRVETQEELFGTLVKADYDIDELFDDMEGKRLVDCRASIKFRHKVPLNTFKFLEATLSRLNKLVETLAGGINV